MRLLIFISTVALASASTWQSYSPPSPVGPHGDSHGNEEPLTTCNAGEVFHAGRCVTPHVNRRVLLYDVPAIPPKINHNQHIPEPTVEHNVVFVRLPEAGQGSDPIVVPPPQQKHVIYVLSKQTEQDQHVIEVPAPPPSNPDVYFVNYAEGENPTLPDGVDLLTALASASQGGGQVIGFGGQGHIEDDDHHDGGLSIGFSHPPGQGYYV